MTFNGKLDARFSEATAPVGWQQVSDALVAAELYWLTTGANTWNDGLDVVVEGNAERLTGLDTLTRPADAIREKYCGEWDFTAHNDGFGATRQGAGLREVTLPLLSDLCAFTSAQRS
jgi:hypothetical protein